MERYRTASGEVVRVGHDALDGLGDGESVTCWGEDGHQRPIRTARVGDLRRPGARLADDTSANQGTGHDGAGIGGLGALVD